MSPEQYEANAKKVVLDLIGVLPDTKYGDETWRHAWNEMSDTAQDSVKTARKRGEAFAAEVID